MRYRMILVVALASVAPAAIAQTFEVSLNADPNNHMRCAAGDGTWVKKWSAQASDTSASVTGTKTTIPLTKTSPGQFQSTVSAPGTGFDGKLSFTIYLDANQRSLKVVSNNLGCTWQGKV
jgi:hypothetical protein